ncbi:MAG: STAS domain-containing protein [Planctomycetota bacterium]|jgi:anti-sigma B factor antagonist
MHEAGSLQFDVKEHDTSLVVSPEGEVDLSTSPELREALKAALRRKPGRLVIKLDGVPSMDSSAIATLIEAMRLCKGENVDLILCCVTERVRSVFEIARLDSVFDIRETLDNALA